MLCPFKVHGLLYASLSIFSGSENRRGKETFSVVIEPIRSDNVRIPERAVPGCDGAWLAQLTVGREDDDVQ